MSEGGTQQPRGVTSDGSRPGRAVTTGSEKAAARKQTVAKGTMAFDKEVADKIVGYTIIVGFNRARRDGSLIEKVQRCGRIIEVSEGSGIIIECADKSTFSVPPQFEALRLAKPGVYTLHSTKEELENPAYTMIWTIWGADTDDQTWVPVYEKE